MLQSVYQAFQLLSILEPRTTQMNSYYHCNVANLWLLRGFITVIFVLHPLVGWVVLKHALHYNLTLNNLSDCC